MIAMNGAFIREMEGVTVRILKGEGVSKDKDKTIEVWFEGENHISWVPLSKIYGRGIPVVYQGLQNAEYQNLPPLETFTRQLERILAAYERES